NGAKTSIVIMDASIGIAMARRSARRRRPGDTPPPDRAVLELSIRVMSRPGPWKFQRTGLRRLATENDQVAVVGFVPHRRAAHRLIDSAPHRGCPFVLRCPGRGWPAPADRHHRPDRRPGSSSHDAPPRRAGRGAVPPPAPTSGWGVATGSRPVLLAHLDKG